MRGIALGVLLGVSAFGQAQKDEHSVNGVVRDALSGEPVRNALVAFLKMPSQLSNPPGGGAEEPKIKETFSGPGGEFHFEGMPDGLYVYVAHKPGFAEDQNAKGTIVIQSPSGDSAVVLKLTPLGAIEGKVVNQYDEPLENVVLHVYALDIRDGEKTMNNVGTIWTDDRGMFHLAYLQPGNYCVKVVSMRGGTETHFGGYGMRYAPWEGFLPVYFGGATDIASAALIPVAAGARVRTDFRLEVQPAFKIRGIVQGYAPPNAVSFELLRGDDQAEPSRALLDVTTGKFEVLDVVSGSYRLRAAQENTRGEVVVNVGGADVEGVFVALQPAAAVKGVMRSVGGRADVPRPTNPCFLSLHPRWYSDTVHTRQSGQFSFDDLFPGEYQVRLQCFGAYVQSALFGGVDLLTTPVLTIPSDGPSPPIEIEYTPGGGTLQVKVADPLLPQAAVLVAPAFSASTGPALQSLQSMNRAGRGLQGQDFLQFSNLAPGDYLVYGLPQADDAEFRNPAFLRTLSGGTQRSHRRWQDR